MMNYAYNKLEDYPSLFQCSQCEWECYDTMCGDTLDYNYCPNCGKKIIKKAMMDDIPEIILTNRNIIALKVVGELVRCADCKHREAENGFCKGRGWPMQIVPDDGFCDKGERSKE